MTDAADAVLVAALVAVDPVGLGGVSLRGGPGYVRERFLAQLRAGLPPDAPWRRVPHSIGDDGLLGGLDLAATLRAGRPMVQRGVLAAADGGVVLLAMAERVPPTTVARLAAALDEGAVGLQRDGLALRLPTRFGVVALDEGLADDERPPAALLDRLAFHVDLGLVNPRADDPACVDAMTIAAARRRLPAVEADGDVMEALCGASMALGVASLRAPILALRAAMVCAALEGHPTVTTANAATAARLVLAPRATRLPEEAAPPEEADQQPPPPDSETETESQSHTDKPIADIVLEAARTALPPDLLARLVSGGQSARVRSTGRAGEAQHSLNRGRPIGVLSGELRMGARLHLVETLKAAAPWQRLRRIARADTGGPSPRLEVRRPDFRIIRFRHHSQTLTIFVVDASGSSALHRLGEAKGAVELLLADCYVRRDQVALIAFRGRGAELVLPPTGALARAKRSLAGLPGGGGTPLAAGLDAAAVLAGAARRKGQTPILTVLTDGRANIAADGTGDRARAEADAIDAARRIRMAGFAALLIDTAPRPDERARRLGAELGGRYVALPQANAAGLSRIIQQTVRATDRPAAA